MITSLEDVTLDMGVEIELQSNRTSIESGIVRKIISTTDSPDGILVILKNGETGYVSEIIHSRDLALQRIMQETHLSENKDCFCDPPMKNEVIPKSVQAFMNSDGGYLYIGIYDDADTLDEKIIGLDKDKKFLENIDGEEFSNDKFLDKFRTSIEESLGKFLTADLGKKLEFSLWDYNDKNFLEICVKRSSYPIFYRNLSRKNKAIQFDIYENNEKVGQRKLEEFAYRDGSRKKYCETFSEYQEYYDRHFQKS